MTIAPKVDAVVIRTESATSPCAMYVATLDACTRHQSYSAAIQGSTVPMLGKKHSAGNMAVTVAGAERRHNLSGLCKAYLAPRAARYKDETNSQRW